MPPGARFRLHPVGSKGIVSLSHDTLVVYLDFFFVVVFKFIYLFWERERAGEGQRENPKQALHCECKAQRGAQTHDLSWNQERHLTDWAPRHSSLGVWLDPINIFSLEYSNSFLMWSRDHMRQFRYHVTKFQLFLWVFCFRIPQRWHR